MIPGVVKFGADFGVYSLADGRVLEYAEVPVIDAGYLQAVTARISLEVDGVRAVLRRWGKPTDWAAGIPKGIDVKPVAIGSRRLGGISRPNFVGIGRAERSKNLPVRG